MSTFIFKSSNIREALPAADILQFLSIVQLELPKFSKRGRRGIKGFLNVVKNCNIGWLVCPGVRNGFTAVEARAPISATQLDGVVGLVPVASAGLGEGEGSGGHPGGASLQ